MSFGTPREGTATQEQQVPTDPKGFEDWAYEKLQVAFEAHAVPDSDSINFLFDAVWEATQAIYKASYRNGRGSRKGGFQRKNNR